MKLVDKDMESEIAICRYGENVVEALESHNHAVSRLLDRATALVRSREEASAFLMPSTKTCGDPGLA
jgi:hypothetical protein